MSTWSRGLWSSARMGTRKARARVALAASALDPHTSGHHALPLVGKYPFQADEEFPDVPPAGGKFGITQDKLVSLGRFSEDAGCTIADKLREFDVHLIEMEQGERDPEGRDRSIPRLLPADTRVGDIAQTAVLPPEQVPGQVPEFAHEAAVSAIDTNESGWTGHPWMLEPCWVRA